MGWFAAGLLLSIMAAKVNWGAVFWQEPRMLSSLRFFAAACLLLFIERNIVKDRRLKSGMHVILALYLVWSVYAVKLVLHPENPIAQSASLAM